jgi:hypothetical protein
MAITDILSGSIRTIVNFALQRTGEGYMSGTDKLTHTLETVFTDGAGASQATCWLSGNGTVTQAAAITFSLADNVNPLSTFSNAVPSKGADPEGLKIRMMILTNEDDTNYIEIKQGAAAWPLPDFDTTIVYPGGSFVWVAPNGGTVINDGADDELQVQANTADCLAKFIVLYG